MKIFRNSSLDAFETIRIKREIELSIIRLYVIGIFSSEKRMESMACGNLEAPLSCMLIV